MHTCHCWWLSIISFLFFQASAALNERLGLSATLSQTQNILVNNQLSWLCVASCNTTRLREGLGKFDSELNSQREKSAFPPRSGTRLNYYTEQNSSSLLPKGCCLPGHQGNILVQINISLEGSERCEAPCFTPTSTSLGTGSPGKQTRNSSERRRGRVSARG